MIIKKTAMVILLIMIIGFVSCGLRRFVKKSNPLVLVHDEIELKIVSMYGSSLYQIELEVEIKNLSKNKKNFDSGDIQVKDENTQLIYYSFSKGKKVVRFPPQRSDHIVQRELNPGDFIQGQIYMNTGGSSRDGEFEKLKITFGRVSKIINKL